MARWHGEGGSVLADTKVSHDKRAQKSRSCFAPSVFSFPHLLASEALGPVSPLLQEMGVEELPADLSSTSGLIAGSGHIYHSLVSPGMGSRPGAGDVSCREGPFTAVSFPPVKCSFLFLPAHLLQLACSTLKGLQENSSRGKSSRGSRTGPRKHPTADGMVQLKDLPHWRC